LWLEIGPLLRVLLPEVDVLVDGLVRWTRAPAMPLAEVLGRP